MSDRHEEIPKVEQTAVQGISASGDVKIGNIDQSVSVQYFGSQVDTDELSSERGVDYARLQLLLKAGNWKDGDQETLWVMLKASETDEKKLFLTAIDIQRIPCEDLQTIDRLWLKYSQGKFGFSVQTKIWQDCSSPISYMSSRVAWERWGERVGWRVKHIREKAFFRKEEKVMWIMYGNKIIFDLSAPAGHLPFAGRLGYEGWHVWEKNSVSTVGMSESFAIDLACLFSRIKTCKINI